MSELRGRYLENLVVTRFLEQYGEFLPQRREDVGAREPTEADVDWKFVEEQFSETDPQGV